MNNLQHQGIVGLAIKSLSTLHEISPDSVQHLIVNLASYTASVDGSWDIWFDVFKGEPDTLDKLKGEREFYEWFTIYREEQARGRATESLEALRQHDNIPMYKIISATAKADSDNGLEHIWREVFTDTGVAFGNLVAMWKREAEDA